MGIFIAKSWKDGAFSWKGESRVSHVNDKSVLDQHELMPNWEGVGMVIDRDFLVFGAGLEEALLMTLVITAGFLAIMFFSMWVLPGWGTFPFFGMMASLAVVFFAFRHTGRFVFRKFVVLDKARGLVHIPRFLGKGYDRIRFEDANFHLIDIPTTYHSGVTPVVYIVRPGMDLMRSDDENDFQSRIYRIKLGGELTHDSAQSLLAFIIDFMVNKVDHPLSASCPDEYEDDPHFARFARFDPKALKDDITWWRDEEGWHQVDEAAGVLPPQRYFPPVFSPQTTDPLELVRHEDFMEGYRDGDKLHEVWD